jgi:two-component system chemotaxis sensor kinase CheA
MEDNADIKLLISEAEDLIQKVEDEIFKLEDDPNNKKPIQELFFAFHTLKGLLAMANLERASNFCHHFETFLNKSKENGVSADKREEFMKLLFESLDVLNVILKRIKKGDMTDIEEAFLEIIKDNFESFKSEAKTELSLIKPLTSGNLNKVLADKKNNYYKIYIRLKPTCVFKKVRLFIIFRALNKVGQICFSDPKPDVLEEGNIKDDFDLYFICKRKESEISQVFDEILEIENIVITQLKLEEFKTFHDNEISKWEVEKDRQETINLESNIIENIGKQPQQEEIEGVSRIVDSFSDDTDKITTVKVDLDVLETLMNYFGELVISKNKISQLLDVKRDQEISRNFNNMDKPFLEIQEIIFNLKLIRVESTFRKYRRLVRDVSRNVNKKVQLVLEGTNVEIDRKILEEINSPIVHLLRNAIYHGIETPAERKKNGKEETGVLKLSTTRRGGLIYITVVDDGGGIDYERIRRKAVEKGLCSPEEATEFSNEELNQFVLMPGFSTLASADQISGRGMGMAIVAEKMKQLGGTFSIYSEEGKGSRFTLMVPFTRAIMNAQLIKVAGDLFAIPTENINQIYKFDDTKIEEVGDKEYYKINNNQIPIIHLDKHLDLVDKKYSNNNSRKNKIAIWVKKDEQNSTVFIADKIRQQMNIVVKPFKYNFSNVLDILGSTIMTDGSICLILDVLNMIETQINIEKEKRVEKIEA